jgi:hypothetical protein
MVTGVIKILDLQGTPIATYSSDNIRVPGLPGCYIGGGFTVLDDDADHNVYLRRFELK